jgi:hypothetical protein
MCSLLSHRLSDWADIKPTPADEALHTRADHAHNFCGTFLILDLSRASQSISIKRVRWISPDARLCAHVTISNFQLTERALHYWTHLIRTSRPALLNAIIRTCQKGWLISRGATKVNRVQACAWLMIKGYMGAMRKWALEINELGCVAGQNLIYWHTKLFLLINDLVLTLNNRPYPNLILPYSYYRYIWIFALFLNKNEYKNL